MNNQTLIGYFDKSEDAARARQELLSAGFSSSDVILQSGESSSTISTASDGTATAAYDGDRSTGVGGFFRSLFGMDDNDENVGLYSEGVRRGGCVLSVNVDSDDQAQRAEDTLQRCGAVDIDERAQQWRSEGWTAGSSAASLAGTRTDVSSGDARTIPVVEEELRVGKREVRSGGVRVFTRMVETPVEETVRLREEHASVQRRPVDRPATEADFAAMKDGSIEVRETSEEAVVSKVARVVEEVSVGKNVTEREQTVRDTVRHTDVQVENLQGDLGTTRTATGVTTGTTLTGTATNANAGANLTGTGVDRPGLGDDLDRAGDAAKRGASKVGDAIERAVPGDSDRDGK